MMSKKDQTGRYVPTQVSPDETFYMTRRGNELMVNDINRLGYHDIELHQVRRSPGRNLQCRLAV